MEKTMKQLAGLVVVLMMVLGLGACETMKGLGKDISSLGDTIGNAASDDKDKKETKENK
jgi:predicted small secreted protein